MSQSKLTISAKNVIKDIQQLFISNSFKDSASNAREKELASNILDLIRTSADCCDVKVRTEETLEFDISEVEEDSDIVYEPLSNPSTKELFTFQYIKKVLDFIDAENPRFKRIQHFFPRVKHENYISRFREYRTRCGTDREKHKIVGEYVFSMMKKAREDKLVVHDLTLKKWALSKAREVSLSTFTASAS